MKQQINIPNFTTDEAGSYIHARVTQPLFNLAGARLYIEGNTKIEACVVELFSITKVEQALTREPKIDFQLGDWYIKIKIFEGWNHFIELNLSTIILTESQPQKVDFNENKIPKNSILVKLKNMSLKYFDNYYIDVRGGETGGAGRNEHGEPHFHIIGKGNNKDLGKVYFPSQDEYLLKQKKIDFPVTINSKMKKEITEWVLSNNQENLIKLNSMWSTQNKFNNRI
jgi:hypothetical protein